VDDVNLKILACNMRRALRAPEECDIPYLLETAARVIDRLRAIAEGEKVLRRISDVENDRLMAEIEGMKRDRILFQGPFYPGCEVARFEPTKPPNSSPSSGT
jgi:hypothetical protein